MALGRTRKPAARLDESGLYDYAVKALGRQMRTQAELRRLLTARAAAGSAGDEAVAAVLTRLREHGYLNDAAYAETYARLRQENEKLGARRVRQSLVQKGVARKTIDETIASRYGQADEAELARQHLERKRIPKPANEKETARVVRRLIAAGFTPGVIYKVLKEWEVSGEMLAALDRLDTAPEEE